MDVLRDVDVIEEILRIYGYNNIEIDHSLKSSLSNKTETDRKHELKTLISEQLTAQGFNEIMNNSLTEKAYYEESEAYPVENNVNLLNPLSGELNVMRQTLSMVVWKTLFTILIANIPTLTCMSLAIAISMMERSHPQ